MMLVFFFLNMPRLILKNILCVWSLKVCGRRLPRKKIRTAFLFLMFYDMTTIRAKRLRTFLKILSITRSGRTCTATLMTQYDGHFFQERSLNSYDILLGGQT